MASDKGALLMWGGLTAIALSFFFAWINNR